MTTTTPQRGGASTNDARFTDRGRIQHEGHGKERMARTGEF